MTYLLSRNTSSEPSSNEDLEGGSVYFGVPVFSYRELEEATKNFDPSKELGDGGFGTVYHGKKVQISPYSITEFATKEPQIFFKFSYSYTTCSR